MFDGISADSEEHSSSMHSAIILSHICNSKRVVRSVISCAHYPMLHANLLFPTDTCLVPRPNASKCPACIETAKKKKVSE